MNPQNHNLDDEHRVVSAFTGGPSNGGQCVFRTGFKRPLFKPSHQSGMGESVIMTSTERDDTTTPESGMPPGRPSEHREHHRTHRERARINIYGTVTAFILWIAFVAVWLFLFAVHYDIFRNITLNAASFLLMGGLIGLIWAPGEAGPRKWAWRIRGSIVSAVGWLAFVILWIPWLAHRFALYTNAAILLASSFAFIAFNAVAWVGVIPGEMGTGLRRRMAGSFVVALAWLAFMVIWLSLYAEAYGYAWEQNLAILILGGLPVYLILAGLWIPYAKRFGGLRRTAPEIPLLFAWLVVLFVWFWFYGKPFNFYQNAAITLVTLILFVGIARAIARR